MKEHQPAQQQVNNTWSFCESSHNTSTKTLRELSINVRRPTHRTSTTHSKTRQCLAQSLRTVTKLKRKTETRHARAEPASARPETDTETHASRALHATHFLGCIDAPRRLSTSQHTNRAIKINNPHTEHLYTTIILENTHSLAPPQTTRRLVRTPRV